MIADEWMLAKEFKCTGQHVVEVRCEGRSRDCAIEKNVSKTQIRFGDGLIFNEAA
jgi:hypothetical protein